MGNTNINNGNFRAIKLGSELTTSESDTKMLNDNGEWIKDTFNLEKLKKAQTKCKDATLPLTIFEQREKVVTMLLTGYRLKRDDKVVALWGLDDGGCSDFKIKEINGSKMNELKGILNTASVASS